MGRSGEIGIGGVAVAILAGMVLVALRGGENRNGSSARASSRAAAPPIDAAAPTVTEKATFALG